MKKPLLIAEIGINHNGTEQIKKNLIAISEPSLGKITYEEILIAKKLRAHIKN